MYLHFYFNKHQNLQVEVKWKVFIFFFHLKIFTLLLCSTLSSHYLSSRHKSSHRKCSIEKAAFKKFTTFTGKHLCWSLFLIKLRVWRPATLFKRESNTGVFLWILQNFQEYFSRMLTSSFSFLFSPICLKKLEKRWGFVCQNRSFKSLPCALFENNH